MARYDQELFKEMYFPPREEVRNALVEAGLIQEFQPLVSQPEDDDSRIEHVRAQIQTHALNVSEAAPQLSPQLLPQVATELPEHPALKALHEIHLKRHARQLQATA